MKNHIYITLLIAIIALPVSAQMESSGRYKNVGLTEYLNLVKANNLEYVAERYNIDISEAAIEAAKAFNDPVLSFSYNDEREGKAQTSYGYTSGLEIPVDIFGKRGARIGLARSESSLQKAILADYFRNLQADATLLFLDALIQYQLYQVTFDSYQTMKQLAEADSIRYKLGIIMDIDALQSKLEAGILLNELTHARAQLDNAVSELNLITGKSSQDTLLFPSGKMESEKREFNLADLTSSALEKRADLIVAQNSINVSNSNLNLVRKERRIDVDLNVEMGNSYLTVPGQPKATAYVAGLGIPLKFSNIYKGDIKMARYQIMQSETLLKQTELIIQSEILKAWQLYSAFSIQVDNFNNGLLKNASSVKSGKIYSYQRGETSLLEVLNAQRTYNEIQTAYYEALYNKASSLIELEKASGIWDITF